jgi:hypothetical protein
VPSATAFFALELDHLSDFKISSVVPKGSAGKFQSLLLDIRIKD